MASLSCRISPRTSTVIFFDRSPLATAIVTSAMLRTCAVRFDAIELTLSVRSFHTPVTSRTCAWPPSLPSVPTSRATRVTSEVNTLSCLIIVLTMSAERRNSPFRRPPIDVERTVCRRSPCATAAMARVTSVVGHSRSSISELTDDSISPQAPSERPKRTRWRVLPSRPTTWPTRSSCRAMRWLAATISLKVSATLPIMPTWCPAMRTEKSPTRIACNACRSSRNSDASPPLRSGGGALRERGGRRHGGGSVVVCGAGYVGGGAGHGILQVRTTIAAQSGAAAKDLTERERWENAPESLAAGQTPPRPRRSDVIFPLT